MVILSVVSDPEVNWRTHVRMSRRWWAGKEGRGRELLVDVRMMPLSCLSLRHVLVARQLNSVQWKRQSTYMTTSLRL